MAAAYGQCVAGRASDDVTLRIRVYWCVFSPWFVSLYLSMVNYQARMQHLPRYPIGTRVSKYFPGYKEPFAGVVDDYSTYSHFYHITYEDGDSEEMTEEDLRIHVIHVATAPPARAAPEPVSKKPVRLTLNDKAPGVSTSSRSHPSSAASSPTSSSPRSSQPRPQPPATSPNNRSTVVNGHHSAPRQSVVSQEDVNKLVGLGISKLFVGDDGRETIVSGTVSAYFIATRKYRVLFFNGVCEDLSYQDVIESIPLSSPSDEESKKRKLADGVNGAAVPSASSKKQKVFESSNGGTAAESEKKKKKSKGTDSEGDSESVSELSPPFDSTQGLTKAFAHNITRSVLYVVVSASPEATGDDRKGLQLELLANGNLKVGIRLNCFLFYYYTDGKMEGRWLRLCVNNVLTVLLCVVSLLLVWACVCLSRSRRKRSRSLSKKAGWQHWKASYRNGPSPQRQSMACSSFSRWVC